MWSVYLLYNPVANRTYIGATTNINRRIRQHNSEIKGGSRYTKKCGPFWNIICTISGFENRSIAYRWEKLLKLRGGKGLTSRNKSFILLGVDGICPPGKLYEVPSNLEYIKY